MGTCPVHEDGTHRYAHAGNIVGNTATGQVFGCCLLSCPCGSIIERPLDCVEVANADLKAAQRTAQSGLAVAQGIQRLPRG